MRIELINTGSELLIGRVLNTHQQWLGRQLADAGYPLAQQQTVPDTGNAIAAAVAAALKRAKLVIVTGGLGPTSDDLTRQRIAELLNAPLAEDAAITERITSHFAKRNRPMPSSVLVQAQVPAGAIVLPNDHGTAPGLILQKPDEGGWLILLPGPPRELQPMYTAQVVPWLAENLPPKKPVHLCTLRTMGVGESLIEEKLQPALAEPLAAGLELGFCARMGEVDVRLVAHGEGGAALVEAATAIAARELADCVYGRGEETLEKIIVQLLTQRGQTVAVAESCTGGLIAHRLTNVPGASAVFLAGLCTYSNEAKQEVLKVPAETIATHGAVSEPTARAMAEGARAVTGADYALATTGIAGPSGGTPDKPVGTVHIACASAAGTTAEHRCHFTDRATFKQLISQVALNELRQAIGA